MKSIAPSIKFKMPGTAETGLKSSMGGLKSKGLRKIKFPRPKLPIFGKKK